MKSIIAKPKENTSFPIAVVVSLFNRSVTDCLKQGALTHLEQYGFHSEDILLVEVPGAVEIPIVVKRLALQGRVEVIIALGAVIRGETSHYDYVCQQVSQGCQQVALTHNLPVIFGVLTTEDEAQALARVGGEQGHKGIEAVECAMAMHQILRQLDELSGDPAHV